MSLCQCGCGGLAPISTVTRHNRGIVKGQPQRFIVGHWAKTRERHPRKPRPPSSPERSSWMAMRSRCLNQNASNYARYGGSGIRCCERWKRFDAFLDDMGRKPTPEHTLDRIDVNGHYEPSNCRWATSAEQARNKRHPGLVRYDGRDLLPSEWSPVYGVPAPMIVQRLRRGWPVERAICEPVNKKGMLR